jgi:hypothetical protein
MEYIPQGDQERKDAPMFRGLLGYFPAALFEVAAHSLDSDRKHNPGAADGPTWARGKSADHEDTIIRHLIDAGPRRLVTKVLTLLGFAPKGSSALDERRYHLRCIAWRALALLQEDCEAAGAKPGVSSRFPETVQSKVADLRHPAETLAIEAFEREQAITEPCPCGDPGCAWAVIPDRFEGLKGGSDAG